MGTQVDPKGLQSLLIHVLICWVLRQLVDDKDLGLGVNTGLATEACYKALHQFFALRRRGQAAYQRERLLLALIRQSLVPKGRLELFGPAFNKGGKEEPLNFH